VNNRRAVLALILLAPACGTQLCQPEEPPTYSEITYLHYMQPNRDASYPSFKVLMVSDDGTYVEDDEIGLPYPHQHQWGKALKILIQSRYNATWRHTSHSVEKVIWEKEVLQGPVRLHGISAPYFGADRRSFIDEKKLDCGAPEVCAQLDDAIQSGDKFDLVFEFGPSADAPLQVVGIEAPTCYSTLDCGIREECCQVDEAAVCVEDLACPEGQRIRYGKLESP
jgi:hypothetical protein